MLMGIKMKAYPDESQRLILSQWMGCAKFVWNAKCDEDKYLSTYAKKYLPIGVYAPVDQTYSQYKDDALSPWLGECPSQILRNSAVNWFRTYQKFLGGGCGKPKRKKKIGDGSIHLTNELFKFEKCKDGVIRLFIGTKTNNIGYLSFKKIGPFKEPKSIHIKKRHGDFWVSFCYEDAVDESELLTQQDHLKYLNGATREFLEKHTVGIDRGVVRPVQAGQKVFDLTPAQKRSKLRKEAALGRYQRRISRQQKGSKRRGRTKAKLSKAHEKMANIRKNFVHQTSHDIVSNPSHKIIVMEDLRTKNMTARPKAKPVKNVEGKWEKNGATAKAGLNKAILDKGWHQVETFIKYKSHRAGKAFFKVPAHHTSVECAACGHTHPDNRKTQALFACGGCGTELNADLNASRVIAKRAIDLILNSGSELSERGVLRLSDIGRGAKNKTRQAKACLAPVAETSKKRGTADITHPEAQAWAE